MEIEIRHITLNYLNNVLFGVVFSGTFAFGYFAQRLAKINQVNLFKFSGFDTFGIVFNVGPSSTGKINPGDTLLEKKIELRTWT